MHKFENTRIELPTGAKYVPAKTFDFCKLFAVVMPEFGVFGVTHLPSGCSLILGIEREKNAEEHLLKLHKAAMEAGISPNASCEEFRTLAKRAGKLSSLSNLSISEYCAIYRNRYYGREFPWEFGDNCPHKRVDQLIREVTSESFGEKCA